MRVSAKMAVIVAVGLACLLPLLETNTVCGGPKAAASTDVRTLALAYIASSMDNRGFHKITFGENPKNREANSPAAVAEIFARRNGWSSAESWYIKSDSALDGKTIPQAVLASDTDRKNLMQECRPISWAVVINIPQEAWSAASYPILWTRGLQDDGTWAKDSPWDGKGGHIAFADGHVIWASSIRDLAERKSLVGKDGKALVFSSLWDLIGTEAVVLEDKVGQN